MSRDVLIDHRGDEWIHQYNQMFSGVKSELLNRKVKIDSGTLRHFQDITKGREPQWK